jgi:hypothetical protein
VRGGGGEGVKRHSEEDVYLRPYLVEVYHRVYESIFSRVLGETLMSPKTPSYTITPILSNTL